MTLLLLILIPVAAFLGILVIAHNRRPRSEYISAPMGRHNVNRDFLTGKDWRPSQLEINLRKYQIPNWDEMSDTERAEYDRTLTVYEKFLEGK